MIPQEANTDKTTIQPTGTEWLAIAAPFALQGIALVSILLIVLIRDGSSIDSVITALLAFAVSNAVAGGAIGGAHTLVNARVRQTLAGASAQQTVIAAQAQATNDTAAVTGSTGNGTNIGVGGTTGVGISSTHGA